MADDLGYGDVSAYDVTELDTPYVDQLATDGLRFDYCYLLPTTNDCVP